MIEAVLFDLSGVLYTGTEPIPGAVESIQKLNKAGLPIRYITNTTRSPRGKILKRLQSMGFAIHEDQLLTAPVAARHYLIEKGLSPFLLIHPDLKVEFADLESNNSNAVLVGDAGSAFTYEHMNQAFRLLVEGVPLIAMGKNRYFREQDGLSLDAGPFVVALEYAAETEAILIGKPSPEFFRAALESIHAKAENTIMVGDDVEADVIGALDAGLQGILVRTGKYRSGDEKKIEGRAVCLDDINTVVEWILDQKTN